MVLDGIHQQIECVLRMGLDKFERKRLLAAALFFG
jgi:hypothetical protein